MKKLTILALTLSMGLTACGGGSDSGGNLKTTSTANKALTSSTASTTQVYALNTGKQTTQNTTTNTNNANTGTSSGSNTNSNVGNNTSNANNNVHRAYRLLGELDMFRESTDDDPTKAFLLQQPTSSAGGDVLKGGINVLIVDDKHSEGGFRHIQLIPEKDLKTAGQVYRSEGAVYTGSAHDSVNSNPPTKKSWRVIGNNLKYAKFGEVYDDQEKRYLVSQGTEVTPDEYIEQQHQKQAKTGYNTEIKYSGIALHTFASPAFVDENGKESLLPPKKDKEGNPQSFLARQPFGVHNVPVEGKVDFLVNFGNKTLKGDVQVTNPSSGEELKVPLKATINGSSFSGLSTYTHDHTDMGLVRTSGSFYGKNAEEMSGVYSLPNVKELKFNDDRKEPDEKGKYPEVSSQMSIGFGSFGAKKVQ